MLARILFVDDDPLLTAAFGRAYRKRFDFHAAASGDEGLELIRTSLPFAAVVADMRMPGMDGVEFLAEVKRISPDTTRIMLTGQADLETAMEAVNKGHVFRFLNKPCDEENLAEVLEAGIRQYDLVTGERILLEQTLTGSVQTLVDLLSVFDAKIFGRSQLLREYAMKMAGRMGIRNPWDLGLAALLAPIGRLAIPVDVQAKVARGERLTIQEQEAFRTVPEVGARMVANIPRLKSVSRIILYSAKDFDGEGYPMDGIREDALPLESRILRVATDFVEGLRLRHSRNVVFEQLRLRKGVYDPAVLAALGQVLGADPGAEPEATHRLLDIESLAPGMLLMADVLNPDGMILIPAGTRLSMIQLERLRHLNRLGRIEEPILVDVPEELDPRP
ncbi:MAG: response regulator [Holophaga sp.]|nr:response regulator [Holophaga sp.]